MLAWHFVTPQSNKLLYGSATAAMIVVGSLLGGWVWYSLHTKPEAPEVFLQVRLFKASPPGTPTRVSGSGSGHRAIPKPSPSTTPQAPIPKRITTGAKPLPVPAVPPVSAEASQDDEAESTGTGEGPAGSGTGFGNENGQEGETGTVVEPPPVEKPKPKVVPAILVMKDKLSGEDPHLPNDVKVRYRGQVVNGSYKICIATNGTISSVTPTQEIMGADESIVATLKEWKYRPQRIPLCFVQFLEFHIE